MQEIDACIVWRTKQPFLGGGDSGWEESNAEVGGSHIGYGVKKGGQEASEILQQRQEFTEMVAFSKFGEVSVCWAEGYFVGLEVHSGDFCLAEVSGTLVPSKTWEEAEEVAWIDNVISERAVS